MTGDGGKVAGEFSPGDTLAVVLRSQAQTIENQQQTIQQQHKTIELLSGATGRIVDVDLTFAALWDRYRRTFPKNETWPRTAVSIMLRPLETFGAMRIVDLKAMHWSDFRDRDDVQKLAPSTRNQILTRITAMMNWALTDGRIASNPFERAKPERSRPKRETEFSLEDEERFLQAASLRLSVFFMIAIDSGMRHKEIRLLRWDQIDVKARTVQVSWAETKGKRSGTAYLTPRSIAALKLLPRVEGSPYVFARKPDGNPFSYATFYLEFRRISKKLGLKAAPGDVRPRVHDCRHSLASRLSRRGAPLPAIQAILRHAQPTTTSLYIHTRPEDIVAAHALLDDCRASPRHGPQRAAPRANEPASKKVSAIAKNS